MGLVMWYLATAGPILAQGNATAIQDHYTPEVVGRRLALGDISPEVAAEPGLMGYVGMESPEHLGRLVVVECPSGLLWGPVLVIDCAQRGHLAYLQEIRFAVDIFGWQQWRACSLPGQSNWVRVRAFEGQPQWPEGLPEPY